VPRYFGECGGEIALIDAAETGKVAGAVDQDLIPDASNILVDDVITREIEALRDEVIDDVLGVVGDASALIVVDDGYDVAVNREAVNGAWCVVR
jgi:hypothetical protein